MNREDGEYVSDINGRDEGKRSGSFFAVRLEGDELRRLIRLVIMTIVFLLMG